MSQICFGRARRHSWNFAFDSQQCRQTAQLLADTWYHVECVAVTPSLCCVIHNWLAFDPLSYPHLTLPIPYWAGVVRNSTSSIHKAVNANLQQLPRNQVQEYLLHNIRLRIIACHAQPIMYQVDDYTYMPGTRWFQYVILQDQYYYCMHVRGNVSFSIYFSTPGSSCKFRGCQGMGGKTRVDTILMQHLNIRHGIYIQRTMIKLL